ncbi:MAG: preprotein translocase subunit TatB [Deltaproteobacteria bacterium RIFOXYD12_FULL_50_9]|nr:MAG: preprotein translocase subunit TatB [Deltaproteobacteria bacterium RIFOXYD12_FULL_50_9]
MGMQFEKVSDGQYSLNVCGYVCPHPQMYAKKSLEKMQSGDVLTLLYDNPSSKETIIQMCEQAGNEILEDTKEGGKMVLKIEKG